MGEIGPGAWARTSRITGSNFGPVLRYPGRDHTNVQHKARGFRVMRKDIMLYRGESKATHERNGGEIRPKGTASTFVLRFDGSAFMDGRFTFGSTASHPTI